MSRKNIENKIFSLERKRSRIIDKLISVRLMIRGSFSQTKRKCGKPNCWCKKGTGHPNTRITWSEGTQPKTKSIPKKEIPWIAAAAKSYKSFRQLRHEIKMQDNELNNLLNIFENEIIQKTKKKKKVDW